MNDKQMEMDETELHAWLDGQLDPDRSAAVEAAIGADGDLSARAEAYADQNRRIKELYAGIVDEPLPARICVRTMAARRARHRWMLPVAASLVWLAVGLAGGWFASNWLAEPATAEASRHVAREALAAYNVYAVEVVHPVEVFANQEAHLVKWLSKRLGRDIRTPDLAPFGFRLVGGRLLPTDEGEPAAQFLYENRAGRRITVYVSIYKSGRETAFRYQEVQGVGAFVWLEPEFGYAIAGDIPRDALLRISKSVYENFEPTP
jgi:anti-sigma factor RsiW